MTVKIYGPTASRAARALWIVHELGIPFEHVALEMKDLKGPEFLKINPNGKVPAMVDGDFRLFESMAINLYLASKYGRNGLFPQSLEDQALCYQWSFWGMTEVPVEEMKAALARQVEPAPPVLASREVRCVLVGRRFVVGCCAFPR